MAQLGPYLLEQRLRAGAAASVWRASQRGSPHPVAIKLVARRGEAEAWQAQALGEVRALAAIDHPHVVQVLDYGLVDAEIDRAPAGSLWIATELASGSAVRGVWDWHQLRRFLDEVLLGLARVHAHGLVHRDVKPANILRFDRANGTRWKLADFGLAVGHADARRASHVGTPSYMAPEQIRGGDLGPWTDLYALGCMGWEIATGQPPFAGASMAATLQRHLSDPLPHFAPQFAVAGGFEDWLRLLLEKRPLARPGRAADARVLLARLAHAPLTDPVALESAADWVTTAETLLADDLPDAVADPEPSRPPERPALQTEAPLSLHRPSDLPAEYPLAPAPRDRSAAMARLRSLSLVGRDDVCARLWSVLAEATDQRATRIAVVRGAQGLGRTRMLQWLAVRAHEAGLAEVFWAPQGSDRLSALARGAIGSHDADPHQARQRARERLGDAPDPALVRALADTAHRSDAAFSDLLVPALVALSFGRVCLVLLDDCEHDPDALRWILASARYAEAPVVFAIAARDQERDDEIGPLLAQLERRGAISIPVRPLSSAEQNTLLRNRFGLESETAAVAARHAGGSPSLAADVVESWWREDKLEHGETGWRARSLDDLEITLEATGSWREVIAALLSDQPTEARHATVLSALLGPWVPDELWDRACELAGSQPSWRALELLAERGLLTRAPSGWQWTVEAARLALPSLAGEHQAPLAAVAATVCQDGAPPLHAGDLWLRAEQPERALPLLLAAAQQAFEERRSQACLTALDLWLEARTRAGLAPRDPEADHLRAVCNHRMGRIDELERIARHYLPPPGQLPATPYTTTMLGLLAGAGRLDHEPVIEWLDAFAERTDLSEAERRHLASHRSQVLADHGRLQDALHAAREALTLTEQPAARSHANVALTTILGRLGELDEAEDAAEQALREAEADPDAPPPTLAQALDCLAHVVDLRGEPTRARALLVRALEILRRYGDSIRASDVMNNIAEIDRRAGDFDAAEAGYREAIDRMQRVGATIHPVLRANLGLVYVERDERQQALRVMGDALNEMRERGLWGWYGVACGLALPAMVDDPERFDHTLTERLEHLRATRHSDRDVVRMLLLAAERQRARGDEQRARQAIEAATEEAQATGVPDLIQRTRDSR